METMLPEMPGIIYYNCLGIHKKYCPPSCSVTISDMRDELHGMEDCMGQIIAAAIGTLSNTVNQATNTVNQVMNTLNQATNTVNQATNTLNQAMNALNQAISGVVETLQDAMLPPTQPPAHSLPLPPSPCNKNYVLSLQPSHPPCVRCRI